MALIRPIPITESPKAVCYLKNGMYATIANVVTGTITSGPDGGSTTNGDYTYSRTKDNAITFSSTTDCAAYIFGSNGVEKISIAANTAVTGHETMIIV